jgi:hypothetical protein
MAFVKRKKTFYIAYFSFASNATVIFNSYYTSKQFCVCIKTIPKQTLKFPNLTKEKVYKIIN